MTNEQVKNILDPIFQEAQNSEEVFVNNNIILDKITEKVKNIVNNLNSELKKFPVLENSGNVITLNDLKTKMNGNHIKTLIDLIDNNQSAPSPDSNNFDYNLQLNLNFKINIKNKEDIYIYNPKSAFVTSNKKDLDSKIIKLGDALSKKLVNQKVNAKKVIDNVLINKMAYSESFAKELAQNLIKKNIKIEKVENLELNREELGFKLKPWNFELNNGDYIKEFGTFIDNSESYIDTSKEMFNNKASNFYQFSNKDYIFEKDNEIIFTKSFEKFKITKWSIEGIDLPSANLQNVKIYHEISEIKKSWNNFYKVLKYYFERKIWGTNYMQDTLFKKNVGSLEQLKKWSASKLMQKWNDLLKNKMLDKKENLQNFDYKIIPKEVSLLTINTTDNPGYFSIGYVAPAGASSRLFLNQLVFNLGQNRYYFYIEK